ncbi:hypothetical protein [Thermaerobacillus caldiproteolyticus]|jgi:hypothetical protein|nr:hypothetical protein [Anoxybacillus caldiproteolyticus]
MIYILRHPATQGELKTDDELKAKYLQEIGYVLVNQYDDTAVSKCKG